MSKNTDLKKTILLEGETLEVSDRVRLRHQINGIKATALCEILKIRSDKDILIQCVYNDTRITVSLEDLENV